MSNDVGYLARPGSSKNGRTAILHAAAEAFTTRGYTLTTIDDIADRLQATKGRVYHYYRSKAEIFLDVHRVALEDILERVRASADIEATPSERLFAMAVAHVSYLMDRPTMYRAAIPATELQVAGEGRGAALAHVIALRDEHEQLFADVLHDGIATGEFRPVPERLLAKFVLGSLNWITMWYRPQDDSDSEAIATEFGHFVVAGVRNHDA